MIAWLVTWGLLIVVVSIGVVASFWLGVRYERQQQRRMMKDYVRGMGAMWGKYPKRGESDDAFRVRLVRAMMEPPCQSSPTHSMTRS